jgi:hypothetical protein
VAKSGLARATKPSDVKNLFIYCSLSPALPLKAIEVVVLDRNLRLRGLFRTMLASRVGARLNDGKGR